MASHELEVQPVQDQSLERPEEVASSSCSEGEDPKQKSGVDVDPNAPIQTRKFSKEDIVHMSTTVNGVRTKGTFAIVSARYNGARGFWEYQLAGALDERLYKKGAFVREKELRLERRS